MHTTYQPLHIHDIQICIHHVVRTHVLFAAAATIGAGRRRRQDPLSHLGCQRESGALRDGEHPEEEGVVEVLDGLLRPEGNGGCLCLFKLVL